MLTGCVGEGAAAESSRTPQSPGQSQGQTRSQGQTQGRDRDRAQDPERAVRGAADALVRAGSSHVDTSMRMASGGTWLTITGSGGFDYVRRRGELRLLLPKDAAGAEEHKPLIELLTPGALYMKDRGEGVPAGKWVRVDTERLPDGNLVTGGATEPLAAAELLRGARDVELVGVETLRGTEVRHYRGTADIARAARAAAPGVRGPLRAAAKGFTVTRVPFDAWLDADGRLRQVSQRFTFSSDTGTGPNENPNTNPGKGEGEGSGAGGAAGSGAGKDTSGPAAQSTARAGVGRNVTVVSTTRFDDFGVAVPVTMPRAADIWTGKIVSAQPG
jgi:hypothetical protein